MVNSNVLREHLADESVALIYLAPPFNSKSPVAANVSSLKKKSGQSGLTSAATTDFSSAQITAFEDSWHWGEQAEDELNQLSGKQRAEHPDHAPDLNFKKAKAESNAAQRELI